MKTATFEIKVFRKSNYIYIVPTDTGTEIEGLTKDVKIVRKSITSTEWAFYGFNSDFEIKDFEFPISLIKKENGDAYTNAEFKIFKDENTGGFASISSTTDLLQQIADNTKAEEITTHLIEKRITAGTYTKAQLISAYGIVGEIFAINAISDKQSNENSSVAIQMIEDDSIDWLQEVSKEDSNRTIKGYLPISDFTLHVTGEAVVFISSFEII